jgi:hypothetical protein
MKIFWIGIICILLILSTVGCKKSKAELDKKDYDLAANTGIPEAFLLKVKVEGRNIRQLKGMDDEGNQIMASGITIDVPRDKVRIIVNRIKKETPPGYIVFVSDRNFGIGGNPDNVSIMKASYFPEVLQVMGTNGWNYDISPEMVIKRLKEWDSRFGLILIGAGFDWFEAEFQRTPQDIIEFAKEVYEFCPDVVDQGTETIEALANEMKGSNSVYLWWD